MADDTTTKIELSPSQKAFVRAEEIFRDEVRKERSAHKRPGWVKWLLQKGWSLLNSSFFLSAVVGFSVYWYQSKVTERQEMESGREHDRNLCVELTHRIEEFERLLSAEEITTQSAIAALDGNGIPEMIPVLGNRSFRSLAWELRSRIDDKQYRATLQKFLDGDPLDPEAKTEELKATVSPIRKAVDSIYESFTGNAP